MNDEAQIRKAVENFVKAYNAGEFARLTDIFVDDLVDMSMGGPTLQGKAARDHFVSRVEGTHAKFKPHLVVNIDELRVTGDWAFQRGTLVVDLVARDGGAPSAIRQRYLEIWRRDANGAWKICVEMDNSE